MRLGTLMAALLGIAISASMVIAQAPAPVSDAKPAAASPPETPAGWVLAKVLKLFAGDPEAVAEDDLAAAFKAQVPLAKLKQLTAQIRMAEGDLKLESIEEGATERALVARLIGSSKQTAFNLHIAVDKDDRIEGLLIKPGRDKRVAEFKTWADLDKALEGVAEKSAYLIRTERKIASGEGGGAPTTFSAPQARWDLVVYRNADEPLAIGSAFKLWVLLALADGAPAERWDEKLAIKDEFKSLPSGVMQDEPAGKEFTLREYAAKMISISDNTATDHLIHHLTREKCEAAMAWACQLHADLNRPFLTTRDLFVLKLSGSDELPGKYLKLSSEARRAMLPELQKETPKLALAAFWKVPRHIDSLEWFASSKELANTLQWLDVLSQHEQWDSPTSPEKPEVGEKSNIRRTLSINPGVPLDKKVWRFAGFKGGSEPGVMCLNWLLERADGKRFVFSFTLNDTKKAIDESRAIAIAQRAIEFLGQSAEPADGQNSK